MKGDSGSALDELSPDLIRQFMAVSQASPVGT